MKNILILASSFVFLLVLVVIYLYVVRVNPNQYFEQNYTSNLLLDSTNTWEDFLGKVNNYEFIDCRDWLGNGEILVYSQKEFTGHFSYGGSLVKLERGGLFDFFPKPERIGNVTFLDVKSFDDLNNNIPNNCSLFYDEGITNGLKWTYTRHNLDGKDTNTVADTIDATTGVSSSNYIFISELVRVGIEDPKTLNEIHNIDFEEIKPRLEDAVILLESEEELSDDFKEWFLDTFEVQLQ